MSQIILQVIQPSDFNATQGNCVKLQCQQDASSFIFSMSVVLVSTLSVWGADLSLKWG